MSVKMASYHNDKTHNESRMHNDAAMGHENMTAGRYVATRVSTLKPPMAKVPNPLTLLGMLNGQQWLFFLVCPVVLIVR